ncbi:MAG: hypothetical protein VXW22_15850, partial [Pseudomonadota bacterium]|nr:hypothetical protein [Pseudomonadota bacterium]
MTHILINDGSRHIYSTGYGNLSRAIITSLDAHTSADLSLRYRKGDVPDEIREKAELDRIPVWEPGDDFDCILRVSHPPDTPIHGKKPLIFYTQNALGELIPEWLLGLKNA